MPPPNNLPISQLLLPTLASGLTITPVVANNNLILPPIGDNPDTSNASSHDTIPPLKENATLTSNDDSLDSNGGKRRRKRKPNKTTRMSSSDNDESSAQRSNDQKRLCFDADVESTKTVQPQTTVEDTMRTVAAAAAAIDAGGISDISDYEKATNLQQKFHSPIVANTVEPIPVEIVNTQTNPPPLPLDNVAVVTELLPAKVANLPSNTEMLPTNIPLLPNNIAALSAQNNGTLEAKIDSTYHGNEASNGQCEPVHPLLGSSATLNPLPPPPASPDECANMSRSSTPILDERPPSASSAMADERMFRENFLENNIVSESRNTNNDDDSALLIATNKKRTVSDDCETIDKIAAMIASTATSDSECIDADKQTTSAITSAKVAPSSPLKCLAETTVKTGLENGGVIKLADVPSVSTASKKAKSPLAKEPNFEDVENKLEEMFAGIEDDRPILNDVQPPASDHSKSISNVPPTRTDDVTKVTTKTDTDSKSLKSKLNASKAATKKSSKTEKQSIKASSPLPVPPPQEAPPPPPSQQSTPASSTPIAKKPVTKAAKKSTVSGSNTSKNKKTVAAKNNNSKQTKTSTNSDKRTKSKDDYGADTVMASASKYKGPYVQVKNDGSSNVINTPITEEIAEMKGKNKKPFNSSINNDRSKIRGLHVSTLSTKYDADTTDKTWICVFCKMGPHKYGLGDLFGPYILTTSCDEYEYSQVEPQSDDFKSKRTRVDMIQKRGLPISVTDSSSSTVTGNVSI